MGSTSSAYPKHNRTIFLRFFIILVFSTVPDLTDHSSAKDLITFNALTLDGYLCFDNLHHAAIDFGNHYHFLPLAILYPKSVSDISSMIKHIFDMGSTSKLTVAARGNGHSLKGQAQAHEGVVINMESLKGREIEVHKGKFPFVDVSGGELWINILRRTLKDGLAPKTWTDYLHLTVGGTLSNAGISGQAFHHGPQIENVLQLEVVTGKGEVITCSDKQNTDLFYGALGGLGQFGIITRARIPLETAPQMVKWIRVVYSEFITFSKDQENLISMENSFNYIEGFVIINRSGLVDSWKSSFTPRDPILASQFESEGKTLYCLEMAIYFNSDEADIINQKTERLLSHLRYIPWTLFSLEISYLKFLERVHTGEIRLRVKGLWDVPHPWLNLMVPKSQIVKFAEAVFENILKDINNAGPILVYPVNKSKWSNKTSLVTPHEDIFYLVAFLASAVPGRDSVEQIMTHNQRILDFCAAGDLKVKQYLPHYEAQEKWRDHFGNGWKTFVKRKYIYDPLAILAPGQKIFTRALSPLSPI